MRRIPVWAVGVVSGALILSGCSATGQAAGTGGLTVALVAKVSNNPYWQAVHDGASAAAKKLGNVTVTFSGPDTESQIDQQVNMLQSALDKIAA